MGLSHAVFEIHGDFGRKKNIFPIPHVFNTPTKGVKADGLMMDCGGFCPGGLLSGALVRGAYVRFPYEGRKPS